MREERPGFANAGLADHLLGELPTLHVAEVSGPDNLECHRRPGPIDFSTCFFSPTAESFGVSAQIGSGVVRGGPQVRFHEGSTRVPPGFREGSTGLKRAPHAVGDITRAYLLGSGATGDPLFSREKEGGTWQGGPCGQGLPLWQNPPPNPPPKKERERERESKSGLS